MRMRSMRPCVVAVLLALSVSGVARSVPSSSLDRSAALAAAARLDTVIERCRYQYDFISAFAAASRQLDTRLRYLGPDDPALADTHYWLANLFCETGRYEPALSEARMALAIRRARFGDVHPGVVRSLLVLARVERMMHDKPAARAALDEAWRIDALLPSPDPLLQAQLHHTTGGLTRRLGGDDDEILAHYRKALEIRRRILGETHPLTIETLCWLAHEVQRQGDREEAERLLRRGFDLAGRCDIGEPGVTMSIAGALGSALYFDGRDLDEAESLVHRAGVLSVRTLERMPVWYGRVRYPPGGKTAVALMLDAGRGREAWEMLAGSMGWISQAFASWRDAGVDSLRERLLSAEEATARLPSGWEDDTESPAFARGQRISARSLSALVAVMEARPPHSDRDVVSLEALQRELGPDEAFVGWLRRSPFDDVGVADSTCAVWGFVVRDRGDVHWVSIFRGTHRGELKHFQACARDALDEVTRVTRWPQRVEADPGLARLAHEHWRRFVAPLTPWLDGVRRLVAGTGELCDALPLECLIDDDGRALLETYEVSYCQSPGIYVERHRMGRRSIGNVRGTALIVGAPDYEGDAVVASAESGPPATIGAPLGAVLDGPTLRGILDDHRGHLPPLPMAGYEVARVAACFDHADVLTGTRATERGVNALLNVHNRYRVIHFATHALAHPWNAERSALALSPPHGHGGGDGLITTREIQLGWRIDADLVTLSGCQTGGGSDKRGEGYLGFCQALLAAGARSVVTSIWDVDDTASALLMSRFYEDLTGCFEEARDGNDPGTAMSTSAALREARLWLRSYTDATGARPFEHPAYWAGFVLVGAPR